MSKLHRLAEALFSEPQNPEISRSPGSGYHQRGDVQDIKPPRDLKDEYQLYKTSPFVHASLNQFADDVVAPGYEVEADSEETKEWFNDEFLPNAGIVAGESHQDFGHILRGSVLEYEAYGNVFCEHVKGADKETITGFVLVEPTSVKLVTIPNKPILLPPEWEGDEDVVTTPRDEAACYLQYDQNSVLGKRGYYDDKEVVGLSQNDVTRIVRNPGTDSLWGEPVTRPVATEILELEKIMRDNAQAIESKAWGIWAVQFGREEIRDENDRLVKVVEWDEDAQRDFIQNKVGKEMGPGDIIGADGTVEFKKFQGEVAEEILDVIEAYVKIIVTSMPTPLYAVGFESNINQFVVRQQETRYDAQVQEMRNILEEKYTKALEQVAEQRDLDTSGLRLHIKAPEHEAPAQKYDTDTLERMALWGEMNRALFGREPYKAYDREYLADVLGVPADALQEEAFIDGLDHRDVQGIEDFMTGIESPEADDFMARVQARLKKAKELDDSPVKQGPGRGKQGGEDDSTSDGEFTGAGDQPRDGSGRFA